MSKKSKHTDDFEVGYGKPPKHAQFKPGQSGNTQGRPKGAKNFKKEVQEVLGAKITVTQNGKPKKISTRRALLLSLTKEALGGKIAAARVLVDLMRLYDDEDVATVARDLSPTDAEILERFANQIRTQEQSDDTR